MRPPPEGGAIQQSRGGAGRRLGPVELVWVVLPSKVFEHSYFFHKNNLEKEFHILCEEDWSRLPKTLFIFLSGQNLQCDVYSQLPSQVTTVIP